MNDTDREAFKTVLAVLQAQAEAHELRAIETRALIERLALFAGVEATGRDLEAASKSKRAKTTMPAAKEHHQPEAAPGDAKELAGVVAVVAEATEQVKKATAGKDAAALNTAFERLARAERQAGAIILRLAGRTKLGLDKTCVKRWRRSAALAAPAFERRLRRRTRKLVAALGDTTTPKKAPEAANGKEDKPPAANGSVKVKRPREPHITTLAKLTDWEVDETGSRSRMLVGEGEATPLRGENF